MGAVEGGKGNSCAGPHVSMLEAAPARGSVDMYHNTLFTLDLRFFSY